MTRALLQQALEALEIYFGDYPCDIDRFDRDGYAAITAIREYLAQPEQEPVIWGKFRLDNALIGWTDVEPYETGWTPLYTKEDE